MATVCHMLTSATQNTTAPKNQSAFDPDSPRLKTMNQTMANVAAPLQANQPIVRQPFRLGSGLTGIGVGVRAESSKAACASPGAESPVALADCTRPVIV